MVILWSQENVKERNGNTNSQSFYEAGNAVDSIGTSLNKNTHGINEYGLHFKEIVPIFKDRIFCKYYPTGQ